MQNVKPPRRPIDGKQRIPHEHGQVWRLGEAIDAFARAQDQAKSLHRLLVNANQLYAEAREELKQRLQDLSAEQELLRTQVRPHSTKQSNTPELSVLVD
jgi:hypothetical protein